MEQLLVVEELVVHDGQIVLVIFEGHAMRSTLLLPLEVERLVGLYGSHRIHAPSHTGCVPAGGW